MKTKKLIGFLFIIAVLIAAAMVAWNRFGKETGKNVPSAEVTEPDIIPIQKPLEEGNKQALTEATGHGKEERIVIKEPTADTEGEFEVVCSICKEVLESGVIAKKGSFSSEQVPGTAGTTDKETTPTPIPVIVNAYTNDEGNDVTVYADGSYSIVMQECNEIAIDSSHYRPIVETAEVVLYKNNYDNNNNLVSREYMLRFEETTSHEDTLFYYMYYYFDCGTHKLTCRLVNADGSFNQYSECVFKGYVREARCKYVKQRNRETGESEWNLVSISFGSDSGGNITIVPEELIYYDEGVIRLYDEG